VGAQSDYMGLFSDYLNKILIKQIKEF